MLCILKYLGWEIPTTPFVFEMQTKITMIDREMGVFEMKHRASIVKY